MSFKPQMQALIDPYGAMPREDVERKLAEAHVIRRHIDREIAAMNRAIKNTNGGKVPQHTGALDAVTKP